MAKSLLKYTAEEALALVKSEVTPESDSELETAPTGHTLGNTTDSGSGSTGARSDMSSEVTHEADAGGQPLVIQQQAVEGSVVQAGDLGSSLTLETVPPTEINQVVKGGRTKRLSCDSDDEPLSKWTGVDPSTGARDIIEMEGIQEEEEEELLEAEEIMEAGTDSDSDNEPLCKLAGIKRKNVSPAPAKAPKVRKGARAKKVPGAPPHPKSAYNMFFSDRQSVIRSETPDVSFGDLSKIIAAQWEALVPEIKQPYKDRAAQAKAEYAVKMAEFNEKLKKESEGLAVQSPPAGSVAPGVTLGKPADQVKVVQMTSILPSSSTGIEPGSSLLLKTMHESTAPRSLGPPVTMVTHSALASAPSAPSNSGIQPRTTVKIIGLNSMSKQPQIVVKMPNPRPGQVVTSSIPSTDVSSPNICIVTAPSKGVSLIKQPISTATSVITTAPSPAAPPASSSLSLSTEGNVAEAGPIRVTAVVTGEPGAQNLQFITTPAVSVTSKGIDGSLPEAAAVVVSTAVTSSTEAAPVNNGADVAPQASESNCNGQSTSSESASSTTASSSTSDESIEASKPEVRMCIREGCPNPAIEYKRWDGEYCSGKCIVLHTRNVYDAWKKKRRAEYDRKQAEEQAKKDGEEQAKKDGEEQAKKDGEEQAKKDGEEHAKKDEEQAEKDGDEKST